MPIRLDARLQAVADLIRGGVVADIGCDHGKLSYYLVGTDRAEKVIATDISPESLKKAAELVFANGVGDEVLLRLGDGLEPIGSREADVVVIAGLGGDVISGIVDAAYKSGKQFGSFVLSPNTHPEKVRRLLQKIGHKIVVDKTVLCGKKYYTLIKSVEGEENLSALQEEFGKFFEDDALELDLIRHELEFKTSICANNANNEALKDRVALLEKALEKAEGKL